MNELDTGVPVRGGRMRIARSRGAASGFLLILLGLWGGLVPFLGPYFNFGYTPDQVWSWTASRGWLEVLPAAVTVVGGLLLLTSAHRAAAMLGGWLAVVAGAWFVVGRVFAAPLDIDVGVPVAGTNMKAALIELSFFYGLGAVIVFLGAVALGRLSIRSLRDIQYAQRPVAAAETAPVAAAPATEPVAEPSASRAATAPDAEPPTEQVSAPAAQEPRHRRMGGLFRRRHETTAAR